MPRIVIEEGLTLRFPYRDASFHEGVEIGMLATLMAAGAPEIVRTISRGSLVQARALAEGFGYSLAGTAASGKAESEVSVTLLWRRRSPKLHLVAPGEPGFSTDGRRPERAPRLALVPRS